MNEKLRSNRILGWSFLASLAINFAWIAWVGHSGLFGSAGSGAGLHPQQFRLYTPIPVKPRPMMVKPKPKAPPKQRPVTPIRQAVLPPHPKPPRPVTHRVARVQPPRPAPKPTSPRTLAVLPKPTPPAPPRRRPPPERRMAALPKPTLPSKPQAAYHPSAPASARPPSPPKAAATKAPAAPATGVGGPLTAGASSGSESPGGRRLDSGHGLMPQGTGTRIASVSGGNGGNGPVLPRNAGPDGGGFKADSPLRGSAQDTGNGGAKPRNFDETTAERNEAQAIGGFPAPDTSDLDASTITGDCVLTIDVNEEGRASQVRIKHSSGSREFDNRCIEIARRVHYRPAVQNHLRLSSRFQQTWSPSG